MEIETSNEGNNKRLNGLVAATVVVLSVFMAVCNIKDGNVVQALQVAKADEVDAWGEYQGTKLKLTMAEATLAQLRAQAIGAAPGSAQAESYAKEMTAQQAIIDKQTPQAAEQLAKAKGFRPSMDTLNVTDDQFDLSEAFVSIAIALAAVAALVASYPLLIASWVSGVFGIIMGLAGFLSWPIHPDWLISWLT